MAPPIPQNINKSTEGRKTQPMIRKTSMPQANRTAPTNEKQSAAAEEKLDIVSAAANNKFKSMNAAHQKEQKEILSVLMDAGKDWKPRNKGIPFAR